MSSTFSYRSSGRSRFDKCTPYTYPFAIECTPYTSEGGTS